MGPFEGLDRTLWMTFAPSRRRTARTCSRWGGGEGLQGPETALILYQKNGKVAMTDGPFAEAKEELGDILTLEARDMNHATQLISQHPSLAYGNIFEIRPVADMSEVFKASEERRRKPCVACNAQRK